MAVDGSLVGRAFPPTRPYRVTDEKVREFAAATGVGWDGGMLGLALHLGGTEGSLAPEEAEAWAGTEEGRSFYRGAADGWAVAHAASGEDPAVAQQRADATYGFYTGTGQEDGQG